MPWPRMFIFIRVFGALGVALVPPIVLGIILRAEGNWPLPLFGGLFSLGFLFASKVDVSDGPRRRLFFLLGLTANVLGTLVLMILLNVSRRSLAEAWLNLVRSGQGRGFFAVLLYGLFCGYSAVLCIFKGFVPGLLAFFGITALALGILYEQPWDYILALAIALSAVLYVLVFRQVLANPLPAVDGP